MNAEIVVKIFGIAIVSEFTHSLHDCRVNVLHNHFYITLPKALVHI